jgi:hypothetical protein
MAERTMVCSSEKPFRCEWDYRFGNEDQNRLLAVEMKLSQQICPQAEMGGKSTHACGEGKIYYDTAFDDGTSGLCLCNALDLWG